MLTPSLLARRLRVIALLWGLALPFGLHAAARPAAPATGASQPRADDDTIALPEAVPDPLEPFNRVVWGFNRGLMTGVIKPTAKVYRFVVRKPVRTGISNFGRNITYPGRLINNLLQGKWAGARDESYRFGCNTVVGVGGLFDVASKWRISKSDADFGQTFGQWGWNPHFYIMLPLYGPSNDRDTVGLAADTAANPLTYVTPYRFDPSNPLTYISPYTYVSYAILYNNLSDSVDDYVRFGRTELDAYSELEYAWTFVRENRVADFQVKGNQDAASLETLSTVFFTCTNRAFPEQGTTRSALIPGTGRKLKFTFWLQPGNAPLVYIVPGLGSHRLAETVLALAELLYQNGFSAACLSSTFNHEFMEQASTAAVPAYTPVDGRDLESALGAIDRRLAGLYPKRLGRRALLGYSMGAFQTLFVAAQAATNQTASIKFDRYVGINTPVRLLYGMSKLDEFYQAPLAWPAAERTKDIENTFLKVAAVAKNSLTPSTSLPFSDVESKFLIGMAFRLILRDVIYSSQRRDNQGVLELPITSWRRAPVYREILQYSYQDYFRKFVIPFYQTRGIDLTAPDALEKASDLRTYAAGLQASPNIRLVLNRDDFLLPNEDLAWLQATLAPGQITLFEQGGHLGNLSHPAVQKAIVAALDGLK